MKSQRINGHGHLLPEPGQIPAFMREKKLFWIDQDKKFMRQGSWSRPVTDPSFFLKEKLIWMEKNQIDKEVLLNLSQLYGNGWTEQECYDGLRFQNDFNAGVQAEFPDKFISGFVVQPRFIEQSLKEIRRCVEELKLPLLCLPTHFLNEKNEWLCVADESVYPIFELANHYKLAVQIHPYDGEEIIKLADRFWRFHLIWMCAQTADAYHFYSLLDFPERFTNLRTCFAHANQFAMTGFGRRVQGFEGRPDLFKDAVSPHKNIRNPNIYVDTLTHDVLTLELIIKRIGCEQIVAGLDDPYPLGEMETVPNCYPGKVIEEAFDQGIISAVQKKSIWQDNVLKWLYPAL
jgi:aminocarboxymuconate-semialdehyde decarboxylase